MLLNKAYFTLFIGYYGTTQDYIGLCGIELVFTSGQLRLICFKMKLKRFINFNIVFLCLLFLLSVILICSGFVLFTCFSLQPVFSINHYINNYPLLCLLLSFGLYLQRYFKRYTEIFFFLLSSNSVTLVMDLLMTLPLQ